MPNPTSKLNLVINGTTTQLDIHDANAVDLTNNQTVAGNKEFTGTTTAHDLVPSATDTYNFGSSTAQWNNLYAKNYYYNGTAWGLNKANQWSANNKFTGNVSIEKSNDSPTTLSDTSLALTGTSQYIFFRTKGSSNYKSYNSFLWGGYLTNGTPYRYGRIRLYRASAVYGETGDETPDTSFSFIDVALHYKWVSLTDNVKFINDGTTNACGPLTNNATDLGTSTNKWKSFNGINPGALSLPGTSVNVDTTNWVLDGSNVNIFTPASDGWLGIQVTDTVYDQMHYVFVGRNDSASYYSQNVLSPINALWDSKYHGCVFIPVVKNVNYDIRCICSTIVATFYPCKGNV